MILRANSLNAPIAMLCGGGRFYIRLCLAEHEREIEEAEAKAKAMAEEEIYRMYVSDALQIIEKNTAVHGGSAHAKSYRDIVELFRNPEKASYQSAQETMDRFLTAFGKEEDEEE